MHVARSHRALVAVLTTFVALATAHPAFAQGRALGSPVIGAVIPPWSPASVVPTPSVDPQRQDPQWQDPQWQAWDPAYQLENAELHAAPGGNRVLHAAQSMIDDDTIVRGSCYDWVEAVFQRANGRWHDTFHHGIRSGPYAQAQDFQPGDWVLFVNEEFGGDPSHTHSAIFIGWADQSTRAAVMMSYPGGRRAEPGRYGTYTLTRAYRIIRMEDAVAETRAHHRR